MLKNPVEVAKKFENDVELIKKEQKRLASIKCRLKKQKARKDYEIEMKKVLEQEQILKEAKDYLEPKKMTVTTMSEYDISLLNYDETVKAIKSIQSKKCLSQYLTSDIETNVEYQEALRIEEMLKKHKETVKPIEETVVKKSDINNLIEHLSNQNDQLDKEYVLEQLRKLL